MKIPKSECCNAPCESVCADEGTCHYVCSQCQQAADIRLESKNAKQLASFMVYCKANPDLRFWQALVSWSGFQDVYAHKKGCGGKTLKITEEYDCIVDVFYLET